MTKVIFVVGLLLWTVLLCIGVEIYFFLKNRLIELELTIRDQTDITRKDIVVTKYETVRMIKEWYEEEQQEPEKAHHVFEPLDVIELFGDKYLITEIDATDSILRADGETVVRCTDRAYKLMDEDGDIEVVRGDSNFVYLDHVNISEFKKEG